MKLTPDQIEEILAGELIVKPNSYGTYTPPKYEPPKQLGSCYGN